MKLSTVLLPLMAATTTLSELSDVFSVVSNNLSEVSDNLSDLSDNLIEIGKCKSKIDGYQECLISSINFYSIDTNIDNICAAFATEKCQSFFSTGVASLPECQNVSKKILTPYQILSETVFTILNLSCSKDENNNYCPLAGKNVINNNTMSSDELMNSLKETCKSKKCYNVAANSFIKAETSTILISFLFKKQLNNININSTDSEYLEKINNYLISKDCISQHTVQVNSGTSNTIIINSVLFICLNFLLLLISL